MQFIVDTFITFLILLSAFVFCEGMKSQVPARGKSPVSTVEAAAEQLVSPSPELEDSRVDEPQRQELLRGRPVLSASLERLQLASGTEDLAILLDFTTPVTWQSEYQRIGNRFELILSPVSRKSLFSESRKLEPLFDHVEVETGDRNLHKLAMAIPKGFSPSPRIRKGQGLGRLLLLDFIKDPARARVPAPISVKGGVLKQREASKVGRGLNFNQYRWTPARGGGSDVHVHRLDATGGGYELQLGLAHGHIHSRDPLSAIAADTDAIAGVNASFFAIGGNGDPLGLLIDRGRLLAAPMMNRAALGLFPGNRVLVGNPEFSGRVGTDEGEMFIDGINQGRKRGKLILYTSDYGARTGTTGKGIEIAVERDRVVRTGSRDLKIPAEGYVVSYKGEAPSVLRSLEKGDSMTYQYGLTPPWNQASVAVGGGPRLVRDGKSVDEFAAEGFSKNFSRQDAPRTAVGVTASGELLLVTVDGRQAGRNAGVSLKELSRILVSLGAQQGINLDGGGSTTSWLDGKVINRPSDGRERKISTALVVVERPETRLAASDFLPDQG